MKLDPTKMKDWQIAEAAEENMKPVRQLADELGLKDDELLPAGRQLGKVDYMKVLSRLKNAPEAKYIDVSIARYLKLKPKAKILRNGKRINIKPFLRLFETKEQNPVQV